MIETPEGDFPDTFPFPNPVFPRFNPTFEEGFENLAIVLESFQWVLSTRFDFPIPVYLTAQRPIGETAFGIHLNVNAIDRDTFYLVEHQGEKYAIRLTKDGMLENYSVKEERKRARRSRR